MPIKPDLVGSSPLPEERGLCPFSDEEIEPLRLNYSARGHMVEGGFEPWST